MSLDLDFNKSLSVKEIEEKTYLKVDVKDGSEFLRDQYGNVVFFKGYGITLYGPRNPLKILDELIRAFDIMFVDDDVIDELNSDNADELYLKTMNKYGYITDGVVKIPKRDESVYLPYEKTENNTDSDLPF